MPLMPAMNALAVAPGTRGSERELIVEADLVLRLALQREVILDDPEQRSNLCACLRPKLFQQFTLQGISSAFADLNTSAGQREPIINLSAMEQYKAILHADASGAQIEARSRNVKRNHPAVSSIPLVTSRIYWLGSSVSPSMTITIMPAALPDSCHSPASQ